MNIHLCEMTKELSREYHKHLIPDPALFVDVSKYQVTVERYRQHGRDYLGVMLDKEPIEEVFLKHIDWGKDHCALGIGMRSDNYKNKGYGTIAESMTLEYVFNDLGLETVFADTLLKNTPTCTE